MTKKAVSLLLALLMSISVCACSNPNKETTKGVIDSDSLSKLKESISTLESYENPYIISNILDAPDGTIQYLECISDDNSYSEYSIDTDGNIGTISYGSTSSIAYIMTDWLDVDGNYYIFQTDEEGNDVIYSLPNTYGSYVDDRNNLYLNDIVDGLISLEHIEDTTLDIGYGVEDFTVYRGKVKSEVVKEILGVSSRGIYKGILEAEEENTNLANLCKYYVDDLDMSLTFSDAIVTIGVDKDNLPKYLCLEVGGLGTRLYFTKVIVETNNTNVREVPDFSNSIEYKTTLVDLADFVAGFDSFEDAMIALEHSSTEEVEVENSVSEEE